VTRGADIIGIGVLVTDITERKQAQQARGDLTRATVAALAATVETRDPYTAGAVAASHEAATAHRSC
jgi:hypothetical protein